MIQAILSAEIGSFLTCQFSCLVIQNCAFCIFRESQLNHMNRGPISKILQDNLMSATSASSLELSLMHHAIIESEGFNMNEQ